MQVANTVLAGSAVAVSAATVELYNATTLAYVKSTTTNAAGSYTFSGTGVVASRNYLVRVVNNTVRSTRPGATTALLPVQTFVVSNGVGDINRVGGEAPEKVDAGNGTTGTTLTSLNTTTTIAES